MTTPRVRPATPADAAWIEALVEEEWGGPLLIADGRTFDARVLPGLIAGEREGLALYEAAGAGVLAELVLLHALALGQGLGTALVEALVALLARQGARELWLTTTNDNLEALRFYQRRGFRMMEVRPGAIESARRCVRVVVICAARPSGRRFRWWAWAGSSRGRRRRRCRRRAG